MPRPSTSTNGRRAVGARNAIAPKLHFLNLPLELRENIISYLSSEETPHSLLSLLQVNRQLYEEAKPFLFRRPLSFDGQGELFAWLRIVSRHDLGHVSDITFKLHDIKPDEIVGALGKRLKQAGRARSNADSASLARDNPYHEACELEVKKIGGAFLSMPNVKNLSLIPCTETDPRPSQRMLVQFSKILSRCFPKIERLQSRERSLPINFVTNKPRLRKLQIPSLMASSCAEMVAVFTSLNVKQLAIYGCVTLPGLPVPPTQIVADMLRAVRPLRELTLYESDVELVSRDVAHELLITSPDALDKHLQSLRTLKILIQYTPDIPRARTVLGQLRKVLSTSRVERLEMAESLLFMLDHGLPRTLNTYVVRLDRPCTAEMDLSERLEHVSKRFEILTKKLKCSDPCPLPNLREVIILFESDEDEEEIQDLEGLAEAYSLFEGTNVRLSWMLAERHASL